MNLLFTALVDDAGLFPPTSLTMSEALARHARDRRERNPMLTHRFLCPSSRLDELSDELTREAVTWVARERPDRIGLIVDTPGIPPLGDLHVDLIEVRLARAAGITPPPGVPLLVEMTAAQLHAEIMGADREPGDGVKVRCGGVTAESFPPTSELGRFIELCVGSRTPFKATAGLHHAVRRYDPALGVWRHGFLNLVLAVGAAIEGREPLPILESDDPDELVRLARAVPDETAERARKVLMSYGSCSTSQPIEDLRALGLVP